ncbi:MAG: hypothetical protein ACK5LN_01875 [Propioniciclava sp.]
MTEDFAVQVSQARSALPSNPAHVDPKEVERVAFATVGHGDLGLQVWTDAREAAAQAWRDCRARMRARYGARSPHGGWLMFVLFVAALSGTLSAALASGFRTDPAETAGIQVVLVMVAAGADLVALVVTGWRPLNWAAVRMQLVVAVALAIAAAFQLSRPAMVGTPTVVAAAGIGAAGLIQVLITRMVRPIERKEIDSAINVATAQMQPEVEAIGQQIQADVSARLSPVEQERIVALRTTILAQLAADGLVVEPVPEGSPAGGVIIAALLSTWNPYTRKERTRK